MTSALPRRSRRQSGPSRPHLGHVARRPGMPSTTPIGMLMRKIIRQPVPNRSASRRTPAMIGPSNRGQPHDRAERGERLAEIVRAGRTAFIGRAPAGSSRRRTAPAVTRLAMSHSRVWRQPAQRATRGEPDHRRSGTSGAGRRCRRAGRRSTSPIANASVYAARTHCSVLRPPPSSRRIEGPAMLTMVASTRSMTSAAEDAGTSTIQRYR